MNDLVLCPRPVVIAAPFDRPAVISQGKWDGGGSGRIDGEQFLIAYGEINHPHEEEEGQALFTVQHICWMSFIPLGFPCLTKKYIYLIFIVGFS